MNPWPQIDYLRFAANRGLTGDPARNAWKAAVEVQKRGLPPVLTLRHLAKQVDVPYQYLRLVVERRQHPYRVFQIRKRLGGYRVICVPDQQLGRVQKWIDRFILSACKPHPRAMAYATGTSALACAQEHAGCNWLIKCDVRQFFESLSEIKAYRFFHSIGYRRLLAFELSRLVTRLPDWSPRFEHPSWKSKKTRVMIDSYHNWRIGHMPQGAPTSPRLSNLVLTEFDDEVQRLAEHSNLIYTRYADDLIFSHHGEFNRKAASRFIQSVFGTMKRIGLSPHTTKTKIAPPGSRKIVLGLCVNDGSPRLTKEFRKRLSCHVHYVHRIGLVKHARNRGFESPIGFRAHLEGLLRYASSVEPDFTNRLREKLSRSDWRMI